MTVSVFREDDEAYDLWHKTMGVPASRIVRFDEKDNFWSMGATGPCGPCSEILYDQGEGVGCGRRVRVRVRLRPVSRDMEPRVHAVQPGRVGEADSAAETEHRHRDGAERLARGAGVTSNYDRTCSGRSSTGISRQCGVPIGKSTALDAAMRVVADHARATAFLIADGIVPSNEGRGYVLRRIMRRALRHGKKLGFDGPFLHGSRGSWSRSSARRTPASPRARRSSTRWRSRRSGDSSRRWTRPADGRGGVLPHVRGTQDLPGEVAFKLYDTYGFPADLTADLCRERGVALDSGGFEKEMEKQRAQSRVSWKGGEVGAQDAWPAISPARGSPSTSSGTSGWNRTPASWRSSGRGRGSPPRRRARRRIW